MVKERYCKWWPKDWIHDTRVLSPATRGLWIDLLCMMMAGESGEISGTDEHLARMLGCSMEDLNRAVGELDLYDVAVVERDSADVTANVTGDVTPMSRRGHTVITIKSRRLSRQFEERISARNRKRLQRERGRCHGSGHNDVTPSNPESRIQDTPQPPRGGSEGEPFQVEFVDEFHRELAANGCLIKRAFDYVRLRDGNPSVWTEKNKRDWIAAASNQTDGIDNGFLWLGGRIRAAAGAAMRQGSDEPAPRVKRSSSWRQAVEEGQ